MWSDKFYELFIISPDKAEREYKLDHVFDTFPILFKQDGWQFLAVNLTD